RGTGDPSEDPSERVAWRRYLRTVLRAIPVSSTIPRMERPCWARSRIVFTVLLLSIGTSGLVMSLPEYARSGVGQNSSVIRVKFTSALIVFNGYVRSIDPATGREKNACILSLQAAKDEFMTYNLEAIDPRLCFK